MVVGLARRSNLTFLELEFKCYRQVNVSNDGCSDGIEYTDIAGNKELHFCLDRWDHRAIASRFFYFVPSLNFVGLSFHVYPQFSYWTVQRGAEDDITLPVSANEAAKTKSKEDMLSWRARPMSLTEEWSRSV